VGGEMDLVVAHPKILGEVTRHLGSGERSGVARRRL